MTDGVTFGLAQRACKTGRCRPCPILSMGARRSRGRKRLCSWNCLSRSTRTRQSICHTRVYPSLATSRSQSTMQAKAELDSMWVVGMLDHQRQIQLQDGLSDLGHFLKPPDGRILPGAVEELWKVYRNKARPSSAEQPAWDHGSRW